MATAAKHPNPTFSTRGTLTLIRDFKAGDQFFIWSQVCLVVEVGDNADGHRVLHYVHKPTENPHVFVIVCPDDFVLPRLDWSQA